MFVHHKNVTELRSSMSFFYVEREKKEFVHFTFLDMSQRRKYNDEFNVILISFNVFFSLRQRTRWAGKKNIENRQRIDLAHVTKSIRDRNEFAFKMSQWIV